MLGNSLASSELVCCFMVMCVHVILVFLFLFVCMRWTCVRCVLWSYWRGESWCTVEYSMYSSAADAEEQCWDRQGTLCPLSLSEHCATLHTTAYCFSWTNTTHRKRLHFEYVCYYADITWFTTPSKIHYYSVSFSYIFMMLIKLCLQTVAAFLFPQIGPFFLSL